jgi:hypothetical protein
LSTSVARKKSVYLATQAGIPGTPLTTPILHVCQCSYFISGQQNWTNDRIIGCQGRSQRFRMVNRWSNDEHQTSI